MKKMNKVSMEIYVSLNIFKMTAKVMKYTNISSLSSIILIKFSHRDGK